MSKPAPHKPQQPKTLFMVLGIVVIVGFLATLLSSQRNLVDELKYTEFKEAVKNPASEDMKIVEAIFREKEVIGIRKDHSHVRAHISTDEGMRQFLEDQGVIVSFEEPDADGLFKSIILNFIPMLIILAFIFMIMRSLQSGGGKALSFGKSRAKLVQEHKPKVTFADIAGIDEAKVELEEIVAFLKEPKIFTKLGGRIPKGVLLIGSPGTGKTILAKGVAGEAGVPFFNISGSDFVEMFVGVGASRVRDLFAQAKRNAPCIVFIDEIDAVGRHRGAGVGGGHDEREQTLNQLLVEMDGFEPSDGVIVIAATNRSDVLDAALLRPGRFDRRVHVPTPDIKGRQGILKVHSRRTPLDEDVDLAVIAQATPGFTGADLENLINEAALIAARQKAQSINMAHIEAAKDKVIMGTERRSMIMSEKDKRQTAYHEAGHALVGLTVEGVDPVHKVTIIPRSYALGVTIMLPEEDRLTMTQSYAEGMIAYAMGGRAAEQLVFEVKSSGASDDINKATAIAKKMVCQWGMSDVLGPLCLTRREDENSLRAGQELSEKTFQIIDEEVHRLVTEGYEKAIAILKERHEALVAIAETLLIKETLTAKDMKKILEGESIVSPEEMEHYQKRVSATHHWHKPAGV